MGPDAGPEVDKALAVLGERARRDVPLAPLTTYGVGGRAAVFVRAETLDDLRLASQARAESGLPVVVLGRGSNLLVADRGFCGLVVMLAGEAFSSIEFRQGEVVRAGGAVLLPVLARQTASNGLTGLEWAVGVPGSVGGALRMNAGGHGADTRHTLTGCRWVDLRTGQTGDVSWRPATRPPARPPSAKSCAGGASINPVVKTPAPCSPIRLASRPQTRPAGWSRPQG
jgi:UDP-N-acetylmuramate dehydrogenase